MEFEALLSKLSEDQLCYTTTSKCACVASTRTYTATYSMAAAAWQLLGILYNAHPRLSNPIGQSNYMHAQLYCARTTVQYSPILYLSDMGKILLQEYQVHNKCTYRMYMYLNRYMRTYIHVYVRACVRACVRVMSHLGIWGGLIPVIIHSYMQMCTEPHHECQGSRFMV